MKYKIVGTLKTKLQTSQGEDCGYLVRRFIKKTTRQNKVTGSAVKTV